MRCVPVSRRLVKNRDYFAFCTCREGNETRQLESWKCPFLANDYKGITVGYNSSLKLYMYMYVCCSPSMLISTLFEPGQMQSNTIKQSNYNNCIGLLL